MEGMFLVLLLCAGTSIWEMSWVGQMLSGEMPDKGLRRSRGACGGSLAKVACALPGSMARLGLSWCDIFHICPP